MRLDMDKYMEQEKLSFSTERNEEIGGNKCEP
jgi:hypothetical protein